MPNVRITVETGAGVLLEQPITTAQGVRSVARVDRAGEVSFTVPVADPRGAALAERRVVRAWTQVGQARTEVAAGIIDTITEQPDPGGASTLAVKGSDLLDELVTRSVHGLDLSSGGAAIPIATALSSIMALAPAGWTLDSTTYGSTGTTNGTNSVTSVTNIRNFSVGDGIAGAGIPAGTTIAAIVGTTITLSAAATATASGVVLSHPVFLQFGGESVFAALVKVAGLFSEHFRRDGRQVVYLYRQRPSSGVRAVTRGEPSALAASPDLCVITSLQRVRDAGDLVTRVYPFGGGNSTARVNLLATTRYGAPGTGVTGDYTVGSYTLHIEAGHAELCHIRNDAAETVYGQIDAPPQSWKDISDPGTSGTSAVSASNMLFDQALAYLQTHSSVQHSYKLEVAGLSQVLKAGTTIDVVTRQTVDGYRAVDINTVRDGTRLYILEATTQVDLDGVRTVGLTVATIDRWPETMAQTVARAVTRQISADTHLQKAAQAVYAENAGTHANAIYGIRATAAAGLATISGTWGTHTIDTVIDGDSAMRAGSALKALVAGRYSVTANVAFPANATGVRGLRFRLNSDTTKIIAETLVNNAGASDATVLGLTTELVMAANDFVHLQCYQTSGGGLTTTVASFSPIFCLTWVGSS